MFWLFWVDFFVIQIIPLNIFLYNNVILLVLLKKQDFFYNFYIIVVIEKDKYDLLSLLRLKNKFVTFFYQCCSKTFIYSHEIK